MLAGFDSVDAAPQGVARAAPCGGAGPPLLLLHRHPQIHLMRHRVESARVAADDDPAADAVSGRALECGHYIAGQAPEALLGEAFAFFKE